MPKLSPSPDTLQRARTDIEGHIITVKSVVRHMDASNSGLAEIEIKYPSLFQEAAAFFEEMHQVNALTSTTVWRHQLTYLKLLARKLKEAEEECRKSFLLSQQPSQSETQPTSTTDTPMK